MNEATVRVNCMVYGKFHLLTDEGEEKFLIIFLKEKTISKQRFSFWGRGMDSVQGDG